MSVTPKVKQGLEQLVINSQCEFMTYREFSRRFGLGDFPPSWARREVLGSVASDCKSDTKIGLDLTFLLYNTNTGYPSVIGGIVTNPPTDADKRKARDGAQAIIDKFGPRTPNPY